MDKMDNMDEQWMSRALQLAKQAAVIEEVPVGAVLVQDEQIIGKGYNCPISTNDPTAHAEIIAMRDAASNTGNYRLTETTLYVTVEPCLMCAAAIENARIKDVVYGCKEPKFGALVSGGRNWRFSHRGGLMDNEAKKLMQDFFIERRK